MLAIGLDLKYFAARPDFGMTSAPVDFVSSFVLVVVHVPRTLGANCVYRSTFGGLVYIVCI